MAKISGNTVARLVIVCVVGSGIIVTAFVLHPVPTPEPEPEPTFVTRDCTDRTAYSVAAHALVNRLEAGLLSGRGFVFKEGTTGDAGLDVIPLANPGFEYQNVATQNWTSAQESVRSTEQVKHGSYSLKVTGREQDGQHWTYQYINNMSYVAGEYVTFGAWLWCDTPNRLCLGLRAFAGTTQLGVSWSSYHPGDGQWHWLTVTRKMDAGLDRIRVDVHIRPGTVISGYADGAVLAQNAVFEDGEFETGSFSLVITGLEPDTWYTIRAFAVNTAGVSYGNNVTCSTLE